MQALVSRRQNNEKAEANIRWLCEHSHAHLHVDLIAGLPGEDIESFARGFDRLFAMKPHEIQFGILKRLRGTPIIRHTKTYALVFDAHPPYSILSTDRISFADMQRLVRFSRYWDLIANSGRFAKTLALIVRDKPFAHFMDFSDWLYASTDATHRIALDRLAMLVAKWLQMQGIDKQLIDEVLAGDHAGKVSKSRGKAREEANGLPESPLLHRQARHLAA